MKEININRNFGCSGTELWDYWSSTEGLARFFGTANEMELRLNGPFEIYFSLDAPVGQRGSEHCKVLSFIPYEMLSFSWNAPPSIPKLRKLGPSTFVVLTFKELDASNSSLNLRHLGWGEGQDWDECYAYFENAWETVLDWLENAINN